VVKVKITKSKRGCERSEAQIQAQKHNWAVFTVRGMCGNLSHLLEGGVSEEKVAKLKKAMEAALEELEGGLS
jgi:hypothetical protein